MNLRFAFVNCNNLYPVGAHGTRGPKTEEQLSAKVENLASTVRKVSEDRPPEVLALCEVGSEAIGRRLANTVEQGMYKTMWSGPPPIGPGGPETGLMICYTPSLLCPLRSEADAKHRGPCQRAKWMAVALQLQTGIRPVLWVIANHWKSLYGGGESPTEMHRIACARELGEFYLEEARQISEAVILIGDFNCEPGDRPFKQEYGRPLKGVRERALMLRDRNRLAYFYNPMWRWLGEPDVWETAGRPEYQSPRPIGTHAQSQGTEWRMWDQLFVTKPLLSGEAVRFLESSVRIEPPHGNCSDHSAIGATFDCR